MNENNLRRALAFFVQETSIKLRLSPVAIGTALVLTHCLERKISIKGMQDIHLFAEAIVLIVSKTAEESRRVRDVVNVAYRMLHPSPQPPLEINQKYKSHKESVLATEQMILRSIGFSLNFEVPHKYLLNYLHSLGGSQFLAQTCWNVLNDILLSSKIALTTPSLVALSVIYYSILKLRIQSCTDLGDKELFPQATWTFRTQLNESNESTEMSFWAMFGATDSEMISVSDLIAEFYEVMSNSTGNLTNGNTIKTWESYLPAELRRSYNF